MKTKTKSPAPKPVKDKTLGKVWAELWEASDSNTQLSSVGKGMAVDFVMVQKGDDFFLCDCWFVSRNGLYSRTPTKEADRISLHVSQRFLKKKEFGPPGIEFILPMNSKAKVKENSLEVSVSKDCVVGAGLSHPSYEHVGRKGTLILTLIKSSEVRLNPS